MNLLSPRKTTLPASVWALLYAGAPLSASAQFLRHFFGSRWLLRTLEPGRGYAELERESGLHLEALNVLQGESNGPEWHGADERAFERLCGNFPAVQERYLEEGFLLLAGRNVSQRD